MMAQPITDMADLPDARGAYALAVRLAAPLSLDRRRWRGKILEAGLYIYCGSANGPGGIGARLRRHARPSKVRHWHIDALTAAAPVVAAGAFVGGAECEIMDRLIQGRWVQILAAGFGSTDCRHCSAHLAKVPAACNLENLLRRLGAGAIWLA
jgi:Uri superfamily endonuclease